MDLTVKLRWSWSGRRRREPGYRPGRTTRFFLWCAGADPDLLDTRVEVYRAAGTGIFVLLIAILAGITSTMYATLIAGHFSRLFLPFALFWAILIFFVDRSILVDPHYGNLGSYERRADRTPVSAGNLPEDATYPDEEPGTDRWVRRHGWSAVRLPVYLLRVVVAVAVAILISEALVLMIFQPEIMETIRAERVDGYSTRVDQLVNARKWDLDREITQVESQIAGLKATDDLAAKNEADALATYKLEVQGKISPFPGQGRYADRLWKVYQGKITEHRKTTAAYLKALPGLQAEIKRLRQQQSSLAAAGTAEHAGLLQAPDMKLVAAELDAPVGWLEQERAFDRYRDQHPDNPELFVIPWVLRTLLLAIDLVPLGMKMLNGASVYGRRLREQGQRLRHADRRQIQVDRAHADLLAHRRAFQARVLTELDHERERYYRDQRMDHLREKPGGTGSPADGPGSPADGTAKD